MKYIRVTCMHTATADKSAPTPAASHANRILSELARTAYEKFKLWWMIQHGHSINELLVRYSEFWGEVEADSEGYDDFRVFIEDTGFNGEIWPCFDEFCSNEFNDAELMRLLLDETDFQAYQHLCTPTAASPCYRVDTTDDEYTIVLRNKASGRTKKLVFPNRSMMLHWAKTEGWDARSEMPLSIFQGNTCVYSYLQSNRMLYAYDLSSFT